jgi:hypothetical protein
MLGPIIPPSIPMVVYALAAGSVSIAGLFIAGMIPGIILGLGMMAIAWVIAKRRGYPVRARTMTLREFLPAMWTVLPALLMPVIILGGILGGIFTATEAAAVAVACSSGRTFDQGTQMAGHSASFGALRRRHVHCLHAHCHVQRRVLAAHHAAGSQPGRAVSEGTRLTRGSSS